MSVPYRFLVAAACAPLLASPLTSVAQPAPNRAPAPGAAGSTTPKVRIAAPATAHAAAKPARADSGTGILAATRSELIVYEKRMEDRVTTTVGGSRFVVGKLSGRKVITTMCGAGKINAATTAALLLQQFHPSEVVLSGPAGALHPEIGPGTLLLVERAGFHDVGTMAPEGRQPRVLLDPRTGQPYPAFFPASTRLLSTAAAVAAELFGPAPTAKGKDQAAAPRIVRGEILTGDTFCASDKKRDELLAAFRSQAVDTETAAVAQVCWREKVPFLAVRGISYRVGDRALDEHRRAAPAAAANAARFTAELVSRLSTR